MHIGFVGLGKMGMSEARINKIELSVFNNKEEQKWIGE